MAAAAQVTFPSSLVPTRVDLYVNPDGRLGGVASDRGFRRSNVQRGQTYWAASVDFAARPKAVFEEGLATEALISRVQRGQTAAIPVWRRDRWRRGYAYRNAGGTEIPESAVTGSVSISSTGERFSGTSAARIELKAGCYFTVDNVLYMYDGSAGAALDAVATDLTGIFPDPVWKAGDAVELANPYFVGILQEGAAIRLPRDATGVGPSFGPWTLDPVVEAPR